MTRKQRIYDQLQQALDPETLLVEDESHQHRVPQGAETHFKVVAVANHFNSLTRVARHREINQLLENEFNCGLHALSLHLYTPAEWQTRSESTRPSPACREGMLHDTKK